MEARIRSAGVEDVPALARVHLATVTTAYAPLFPSWAPRPTNDQIIRDWVSTMRDETSRTFIAEIDRRAVGTVAVRREPDSDYAQLRRLHVVPERWRTGIGGALHDVALAAMRSAGYELGALWILMNNDRARSFYEHRGWTLIRGKELPSPELGTVEVRYELRLI